MVHGVSECLPTCEQKQKEIRITRENKKKNKKKNSQIARRAGTQLLSIRLEHLIAQVGVLDRTQGITAN
jgi:hypothetical protein